MVNARCCVLDAKRWTLDAGRWTPDAEYRKTGHDTSDTIPNQIMGKWKMEKTKPRLISLKAVF